jgi:hypothetical protein
MSGGDEEADPPRVAQEDGEDRVFGHFEFHKHFLSFLN